MKIQLLMAKYVFILICSILFISGTIYQNMNANSREVEYTYYSDKLNESQIILKSNNRFFAELYFDDDEGGSYSGYWWNKNDSLFLLSDNIACSLRGLMRITKVELLKFSFIKRDNQFQFLQLERYSNNQFKIADFNDNIDKTYKRSNDSLYFKKYEKYLSEFKNGASLQNTLWLSNDKNIVINILNDFSIEFYDIKNKTTRYGNLEYNYEEANNLFMFIDNVMIDNYKDVISIKQNQFDKLILSYQNDTLTIKEHHCVKCFIGDESDYNIWYDYDNSNYLDVINSKIEKKKDITYSKFYKIGYEEYQKIMLNFKW